MSDRLEVRTEAGMWKEAFSESQALRVSRSLRRAAGWNSIWENSLNIIFSRTVTAWLCQLMSWARTGFGFFSSIWKPEIRFLMVPPSKIKADLSNTKCHEVSSDVLQETGSCKHRDEPRVKNMLKNLGTICSAETYVSEVAQNWRVPPVLQTVIVEYRYNSCYVCRTYMKWRFQTCSYQWPF